MNTAELREVAALTGVAVQVDALLWAADRIDALEREISRAYFSRTAPAKPTSIRAMIDGENPPLGQEAR